MSREIKISFGMNLRKLAPDGQTLLNEYSSQGGFTADMTGSLGPTPGAITVATTGTQVSFTALTRPTFAVIRNLGRADLTTPTASDYIEYGIYDPATHKFYPLGEVGPGEAYPLKFSRNLQEIYLGPGTGTAAGGETARLMLLAHRASLLARVDAFEY